MERIVQLINELKRTLSVGFFFSLREIFSGEVLIGAMVVANSCCLLENLRQSCHFGVVAYLCFVRKS